MKTNTINPWSWQDNFGYAQAVEVKHNNGTLYCSGQAAIDVEGAPVAGDMKEQIQLAFQNLHKVIEKAGYQTSNTVRVNFYTISIADFFAEYGEVIGWFHAQQCKPASTLVEVKALAYPGLLVEIEATIVG
ncbi:RidA family protein [Dyadobacter luticola]|uniref:RidA family protein n=1 Tax=Dyadobacter luticola TaxID=1979387 RepID=A0A5R9KZF6_9BACT|nr:RidA family protein [Dyadobacter luticola]TLV01470.1 RidA family protein [Dyadobacter luticola]